MRIVTGESLYGSEGMMTNIGMRDMGDGPHSWLPKSPTGIEGFDQITGGGLPAGRPTLICGPPGSGKSLFAVQFLVNGATRYAEPGVFLTFEEKRDDVVVNVGSLGFDLDALERGGQLMLDALLLRPGVVQTGEFNLEALKMRLVHAVEKVGAKRVAIDSVEALFAAFAKPDLIRSELQGLFDWLKDQQLTTVITGESGVGMLTRHGIEEYLSDCVVVLDHRVEREVVTRRMRVLKYRGSTHGLNEYPFLVGPGGVELLPITSLGLDQPAVSERISTGVADLDEMLGGQGVFRGCGVLISGTSGTGKTTIAANFAAAACARGEKVLFFSFEESQAEIERNMASVGLDIAGWVAAGLWKFHCERPTTIGLEDHLVRTQRLVQQFAPTLVILDPVSSLDRGGSTLDVSAMLMRQIYYLKKDGITAVMTVLHGESGLEQYNQNISSLVDTWIQVVTMDAVGERNRGLYVLKSRGTAHSNQVREFLLSRDGVSLVPVVVGPDGVLTGSARLAAEGADQAAKQELSNESADLARTLERRRALLSAKVAAMQAEFEVDEAQTKRLIETSGRAGQAAQQHRREQERRRSSKPESMGS
jgi:circadian clock protein KaiC